MTEPLLLNSLQMAEFAARGYLRFDGVIPESINREFLNTIEAAAAHESAEPPDMRTVYRNIMATSQIPAVPAGTDLETAYPTETTLGRMIRVPEVAGAIASLVGPGAKLDHHFLHVAFPEAFYQRLGRPNVSQHTHQDSTIDPRAAFDIQLFYFPHDVTREMGGTRFLPGTHLRIVSEAAISRYQNVLGQQHVVCPAGTVIVMHHGIWHGGGINRADNLRFMFKIRLCPTQKQVRLWNLDDLPAEHLSQRPIFWLGNAEERDPIHEILTRPEPWHEQDTGRMEYLNRIRLWRYLLGDDSFDADYWLTRVENQPA